MSRKNYEVIARAAITICCAGTPIRAKKESNHRANLMRFQLTIGSLACRG